MNENKITVSKNVQEEMTRLRQKARLNSHIPFLYKDTSESFKIVFQNVRLLHLHIADVACDYNVKAADINIFVETGLCSNDDNALYEIPGFQLFRNDFMQHGTRTHLMELLFILKMMPHWFHNLYAATTMMLK